MGIPCLVCCCHCNEHPPDLTGNPLHNPNHIAPDRMQSPVNNLDCSGLED